MVQRDRACHDQRSDWRGELAGRIATQVRAQDGAEQPIQDQRHAAERGDHAPRQDDEQVAAPRPWRRPRPSRIGSLLPLDPPPPPEPDRRADEGHRHAMCSARCAIRPRRCDRLRASTSRSRPSSHPNPTPPKPRPTSELACWSSRSAVATRPGSLAAAASPRHRTRRWSVQAIAHGTAARRATPAVRATSRPVCSAPKEGRGRSEDRLQHRRQRRGAKTDDGEGRDEDHRDEEGEAQSGRVVRSRRASRRSRRVAPRTTNARARSSPPTRIAARSPAAKKPSNPGSLTVLLGREQDSADVGEQALDPRRAPRRGHPAPPRTGRRAAATQRRRLSGPTPMSRRRIAT